MVHGQIIKQWMIFTMSLASFLGRPQSAASCPFCESETGRQVRAGVFNDMFVLNVTFIALPLLVLLGIVALIHFDVFSLGKPARPQTLNLGRERGSNEWHN
jgi:hypothetical protein